MPNLPFNNEFPPTSLYVFSHSLGKVSNQWVENQNRKSLSIQANDKLLAARPNFPFNIPTLQGSHDPNKALHIKFYWSLRKPMKLCLAQHSPFPGYSFYFPFSSSSSSFWVCMWTRGTPHPLSMFCFLLISPLSSTMPLFSLPLWFLALSGYGLWCHRQRGFGFERGECAPWTLIHKDPCVRASPLSLCPTYT